MKYTILRIFHKYDMNSTTEDFMQNEIKSMRSVGQFIRANLSYNPLPLASICANCEGPSEGDLCVYCQKSFIPKLQLLKLTTNHIAPSP